MKNTRLLFVIWMLFLVLPQGYSQGKKEDSSVLGQVNGFLSKHVKLTAYGQFGYSYTDRKDLDVSQADNQFFGRLGMLILSGDITDKLSWMVQYELFTSQLLELYACYKPYSFFQVKIGRMKTCFTLENQMSSSVYETVNFSRVIERVWQVSVEMYVGTRVAVIWVCRWVVSCSRPLSTIIFWNIGQVYTMVPDSA